MRDRDGSSSRPDSSPGRRACWTALVLVIALAALVGLFGYRLSCDEATLESVVAEIRRRGEPIEWRQFRPRPVLPEENAADLYMKAMRLVQGQFRTGPSEGTAPDANTERRADLLALLRGDLVIHPHLRAQRQEDVREILALSGEALSLCRRASDRKGHDWGLSYGGPAVSCTLPSLRDLLVLSRLLCLAALRAQEEGRPAEAAEYLHDALALAGSVDAMPPLMSFLTADGMRETACTVIEQVVPDLSVRPGGPEASQATRRLIDDLLKDDGFQRAILAERSLQYDTAERVRSGEIPLSVLTTWPGGGPFVAIRNFRLGMVAPSFYVSDEIELLEAMERHVDASRARTYPAALAALRTGRASPKPPERGPLATALWPSFRRVYKTRYRALARRRLAAAALAMRLYELDHGGRRPARLPDLVPTYLPAVPDDPFAANGPPIRYLPDANRPLLYSVFKNGEDDGGKFTIGSRGYVDIVDSPDLVFFISGDRPVPRAEDAFPASRPLTTAPSGSTP